MQRLPQIYFAQTENKGRGVFTIQSIPAGSLIEICPVILIPKEQTGLINQTAIYNYYFIWENQDLVVALGYGSLYNHSEKPNAEVTFDYEAMEIHIEALRDIEEGEEILIHYHNDPEHKEKIWFNIYE